MFHFPYIISSFCRFGQKSVCAEALLERFDVSVFRNGNIKLRKCFIKGLGRNSQYSGKYCGIWVLNCATEIFQTKPLIQFLNNLLVNICEIRNFTLVEKDNL